MAQGRCTGLTEGKVALEFSGLDAPARQAAARADSPVRYAGRLPFTLVEQSCLLCPRRPLNKGRRLETDTRDSQRRLGK